MIIKILNFICSVIGGQCRSFKTGVIWLDFEESVIKRECPLGPSHIVNMWHMMKNQNFSYFAPMVSLETWWVLFSSNSF